MERMRAVEGGDEEEDEEEGGLPFLLKDWRDSCLVMASTTVAGTFTWDKKQKTEIVGLRSSFKRMSFEKYFLNKSGEKQTHSSLLIAEMRGYAKVGDY